jgi:hypothetical protein
VFALVVSICGGCQVIAGTQELVETPATRENSSGGGGAGANEGSGYGNATQQDTGTGASPGTADAPHAGGGGLGGGAPLSDAHAEEGAPGVRVPDASGGSGTLGAGCSQNGDCQSAHCVDGVCCGSDFCPTCKTCNGTLPGTCTSIPAGQQDLHGGCTANPASCVAGTCDGAGACAPSGQGTVCSTSCMNGADGDGQYLSTTYVAKKCTGARGRKRMRTGRDDNELRFVRVRGFSGLSDGMCQALGLRLRDLLQGGRMRCKARSRRRVFIELRMQVERVQHAYQHLRPMRSVYRMSVFGAVLQFDRLLRPFRRRSAIVSNDVVQWKASGSWNNNGWMEFRDLGNGSNLAARFPGADLSAVTGMGVRVEWTNMAAGSDWHGVLTIDHMQIRP